MTRSKREWRSELLRARRAMPESERRRASAEITAKVRNLPCWWDVRTILAYLSVGSEVRPEALFAKGVLPAAPVFVPVGRTYGVGRIWERIVDEVGIAVDAKSLAVPVVAIVPGLGFDKRGTRLGRGGGFYDRALADLRAAGRVTAIGLGYEAQIVGELPRDAWDQPVDFVVSEDRIVIARDEGNCVPKA